jgi:hypothetical protein
MLQRFSRQIEEQKFSCMDFRQLPPAKPQP